MIKKITIQNLIEGGASSIFKLNGDLYWCSKVSSIEKIDIPYFGIKVDFISGGHALIDYTEKTKEERDEDFFEYKRIITY